MSLLSGLLASIKGRVSGSCRPAASPRHDRKPRDMWQPQGVSSSGFVQESPDGRSKTTPAIAAYRGTLWCLWADFDYNIWYAVTSREGTFGKRLRFPAQGSPVVANLDGHIHAVITLKTGYLVHYVYDEGKLDWIYRGSLGGIAPDSAPCLVAAHGQLLLVLIRQGQLYEMIWRQSFGYSNPTFAPNGEWSDAIRIGPNLTNYSGKPAAVVLDGVSHIVCRSSDKGGRVIEYKYDSRLRNWLSAEDASSGLAVGGVSAVSSGEWHYLSFLEDGPGDGRHGVCVAAYVDGKWQEPERVGEQRAAAPPQLAVLNGRLHCIFADDTETRDLRWYSRPIKSYSPSSWMEHIPDDALLSHLTIPGTHDSVARGRIPFVRTQYLTITQQLPLGIRFLDLRLRVHDDGNLYCYHGGIPAHFPDGPVSFVSIMDEVWTFLRGPDGTERPTETVLISINNDNSSREEQANPAPFYRAVESTISATPTYPDGISRWFVETVTPTLGQTRGRAVLLRRYRGDPVINREARQGLDLSRGWLDNNPEFTIVTPTNIKLHLQDKWRYTQRISLQELVASKSGHVQQLMARAAKAEPDVESDTDTNADDEDWCVVQRSEEDDWFINFCSAVGDPAEQGEIAQAKWIAVGGRNGWFGPWVDGMNVTTRNYVKHLQDEPKGPGRRRLGIVNLDYPELPLDNDLVPRLIEMNL